MGRGAWEIVNIAIFGHSGRMGLEVQEVIGERGHKFVAGWDSQGPCMQSTGKGPWESHKIDIAIDFSLSDNFKNVWAWVSENSCPLVSGVTGLGDLSHSQTLFQISGGDPKIEFPFFWASNMSLGIAALKAAIQCATVLNPTTASISEVHHSEKKDSPSGTALTLAQWTQDTFCFPEKVSMVAERKGNVLGQHRVRLETSDEVLEFYHEVKDRKVFALGAVQVAEWLRDQRPGIYKIEDYWDYVKKF